MRPRMDNPMNRNAVVRRDRIQLAITALAVLVWAATVIAIWTALK